MSALRTSLLGAALCLAVLSVGCEEEPYCFNCNLDATTADRAEVAPPQGFDVQRVPDVQGFDVPARPDVSPVDACVGIDTRTNVLNCGACGHACVTPHAAPTCMAGICEIENCEDGYRDRDHNPTNGCERCPVVPIANNDLLCNGADDDCDGEIDEDVNSCTDIHNCGGCNIECSAPFTVATCVSTGTTGTRCNATQARCERTCLPGHVDLNRDLSAAGNGCEYACTPTASPTEVCDGRDNDCDGMTDNVPPTPCEAGPCGHDGVQRCVAGVLACQATPSPAGTPCGNTVAPGSCDIQEYCDGVRSTCPPDALQSAGTICQAARSACELPAYCDGVTGRCPAHAFAPASVVCHPSTGACDPAELCTGSSMDCPADVMAPPTQVCRAATGACDPAELCDGARNACPPNALLPATQVCRASRGMCDPAESCTGSSAACPPDARAPATTVCNPTVGDPICDPPEFCDGASTGCPTNRFSARGTVCHGDNRGGCDVPEVCDGVSGVCPTDRGVAAGTECRSAAGPCDVAERCDGTNRPCPATDVFATSGVCRPSRYGGGCDPAESCVGTGPFCPPDGTGNRIPTAEVCDGFDNDCDGVADNGFDTTRDPLNCGRCGNSCAALFPHGVVSCRTVGTSTSCRLDGCQAGYISSAPGSNDCLRFCTPSTEVCNGVDDDCDGMIDEIVTLPPGSCSTVGECGRGIPSCGGVRGILCNYPATVMLRPPGTLETVCDGLDNDCDGQADDGFTTGGACSVGVGGCTRAGTFACNAAGTGTACVDGAGAAVVAGLPATELCDNLDNDCDGLVDESAATNSVRSFVSTNWAQIDGSGASARWIMQYEAARPDATATSQGSIDRRACGEPNRMPWTNLTYASAVAACGAIGPGVTLCPEAQWVAACRTPAACGWSYASACTTYNGATCNGVDAPHAGPEPVIRPTRSFSSCAVLGSDSRQIFDLSGNVREFTLDRGGGVIPLRGGAYDNLGNGTSCAFDWTVVGRNYAFRNTGFRCCYTGATPP